MLDLSLPKSLDALCLGRAGMDLYAAEPDTPFGDVTTFKKHVGGSPANIAVGMARLGAKVGFIGRVSDDVVGHYVKSYLDSEGVDTRCVTVDASGTRTSLALTEMRAENCAVVIYRNNAADLALSITDIEPAHVASARMLLVSGTALSANPSREAVFMAIEVAVANQTMVVLDLDYRAYTWPSLAEAASVYQRAASVSNIVIGNREEYEVLGCDTNSTLERIATYCLQAPTRAVLIKAGAAGSTVFSADEGTFMQSIYPVTVKKPFGAGDAYAAAICAGLIEHRTLRDCVARGAAAAAIVVAGDSCSASSPTTEELTLFMRTHTTQTTGV